MLKVPFLALRSRDELSLSYLQLSRYGDTHLSPSYAILGKNERLNHHFRRRIIVCARWRGTHFYILLLHILKLRSIPLLLWPVCTKINTLYSTLELFVVLVDGAMHQTNEHKKDLAHSERSASRIIAVGTIFLFYHFAADTATLSEIVQLNNRNILLQPHKLQHLLHHRGRV